MKNLHVLLAFTLLFSFSTFGQDKKNEKATYKTFDVINPTANDRPVQFLTLFLRNNKQLNLNRTLKKILLNPNNYTDTRSSLRAEKQFGKGTTSLTRIFLDDVEIFGEGINRLFVLENIRTDEIEKITRSKVTYDQKIKIYRKSKKQ